MIQFEFFRILILCCCKFTFILIVVAIIDLTFVPFQQLSHCFLVHFGGSHGSRGFYYPVLLSSCNVCLEETIKVQGFVVQFCYPVAKNGRDFHNNVKLLWLKSGGRVQPDIVVTCLCPIHPVNAILLVLPRWIFGYEGFCCGFRSF